MSKKLKLSLALIIIAACFLSCSDKNSSDGAISILAADYIFGDDFTISEIAQNGGVVLASDGMRIKSYDISTGETEAADADYGEITAMCFYDDSLYVLSHPSGKIYETEYPSFDVKDEFVYPSEDYSIRRFCVTKQYILLYGQNKNDYVFYIIDKKDKSCETVKTTYDVGAMDFYRDDSVILHINTRSSANSYFTVYDIEKDIFGDKMYSQTISVKDICYSDYTDEVFYTVYDALTGTVDLKALDINSGNIRTVKKYYAESNQSVQMNFISTDRNVIVINSSDSGVEIADIDDLGSALTIATYAYTPESMQYLLTKYCIENNVIINEVKFSDKDKMQLKLMAGDDDIDLYLLPSYANIPDFVRNHAYEDLSAYPILKDNVETPLIKTAAGINGEIFGIPIETFYVNSDSFTINSESYLYTNNIVQYMLENINLYDKTFADSDGAVLAEFLEHMKNADKNSDTYAVPKNGQYTYIMSDYIILNPASDKKDAAAEFLHYIADALSS